VREALFNALEAAGDLDGARVLDLYAGSGALGLEALSRGAHHALFVESDRRAAGALRANVAALGLGGSVRQARVEAVLAEPAPDPFDLVVADPPYQVAGDRLDTVLGALVTAGWVGDGGVVVLERAARDPEPRWPDGFRARSPRRYGDTVLFSADYEA
jgi:16S rRNA (guanine966-N2)-methyltransferase